MALRQDLMGAGIGGGAAGLLGDEANVLVRCTGIESKGAPILSPGYNTVATQPEQYACLIPGDLAVGKRVMVFVSGKVAASVFPPADCMMNAAFPGVPVEAPPGKPVIIERMNAMRFVAMVSA